MRGGWRSILAGVLGRFSSAGTAPLEPLTPADAAHTWVLPREETNWQLKSEGNRMQLEPEATTWILEPEE